MKKILYTTFIFMLSSSLQAKSHTASESIIAGLKKSMAHNKFGEICVLIRDTKDLKNEYKITNVIKKSDFCTVDIMKPNWSKEKTMGPVTLPIYPKISSSFIIASFENEKDKAIRSLSKDLKTFITLAHLKGKASNEKGHFPNEIEVSGTELVKKFPNWSSLKFFAISKTQTVPVKPTLIRFTPLVDSGLLQLRADFSNVPTDTILIKVGNSKVKIEEVAIGASLLPLEANHNLFAVGITNDLIYFSSVENTNQDFTFVWNKPLKRIEYFSASSGNSWGNENNNQKDNYILTIDKKKYILRKTDLSMEAISISEKKFRSEIIADLRAPEL